MITAMGYVACPLRVTEFQFQKSPDVDLSGSAGTSSPGNQGSRLPSPIAYTRGSTAGKWSAWCESAAFMPPCTDFSVSSMWSSQGQQKRTPLRGVLRHAPRQRHPLASVQSPTGRFMEQILSAAMRRRSSGSKHFSRSAERMRSATETLLPRAISSRRSYSSESIRNRTRRVLSIRKPPALRCLPTD